MLKQNELRANSFNTLNWWMAGKVRQKAKSWANIQTLQDCSGSVLSMESNQNVESKTKNVESKIAFGQLILRKIIKTVDTRCQI